MKIADKQRKFNSFAFLANGDKAEVKPNIKGVIDPITGESLVAKERALKYIRGM